MTPEELARLLDEVSRYRGRPPPPPPPGVPLAVWLRLLGAAGALALSLWFLFKRSQQAYHDKYDVALLPAGGPPCASDSPAARRLALTTWHAYGRDWRGETAAFEDALAKAKVRAKGLGAGVCIGECGAGGTCQGVPAIQDVSYTNYIVTTSCHVTYTVHCECV